MDSVNYDQKKYEESKAQLEKLFQVVGYKSDDIIYLPMSGLKGDNVLNRGDNLGWWDGPTLAQAIDMLKVPEKPTKLPLRLPVQDVYSITGIGTVPVGRVETGVMKVGDNVIFEPAGVSGEVKTIEMHHETIDKAEPGDNVGFNVRGVGKDDIRRGDVVGHAKNPPAVAKDFTARVVILKHPSALTVGYTPVFHCHTAQVACKIVELISKLDPKTGSVVEKEPKFLKTGDVGVIKVEPTRPMVIEKVEELPPMGRFAMRDMGTTVAAGMVVNITPVK
jgi:elongation factor 1-alpha